jgi:hypothetical protein
MKCSDINDEHVVELARRWHEQRGPGVIQALMDEGIPEKLARVKVERLCDRGLLDYGTSPYHAWPA